MVARASGGIQRGREGIGIASAGARAALVALLGLTLGVLTAYGQAWLPQELGPLANSSGSWALLAFFLALLGTNQRMAAMLGSLTLVALLGGYVLGAEVRGDPSSPLDQLTERPAGQRGERWGVHSPTCEDGLREDGRADEGDGLENR